MLYIESTLLRVCFTAIFITLLLIFLLPILAAKIINIGNIFGAFISLCGVTFFFFNKPISDFIQNHWHNVFMKIITISIVVVLVAGIILGTVFSVLMIKTAYNAPENPQTLIVLGCKVNGRSPSLMLSRRLDTAYDYMIKNPDVKVIVSGGQGSNEEISESEAMKTYLVNKGINKERIIMEDKSTSTQENFEFSKKILDEKNMGENVTIVTDAFHQYRSSLIAKSTNFKTYNLSAKTSLWLVPTYWVREWFGLCEYFLLEK